MSSSEQQHKDSAEKTVREIRRRTRRRHSSEEKIRIVVDGWRGEDSIAQLCRKEGINPLVYVHVRIVGLHQLICQYRVAHSQD